MGTIYDVISKESKEFETGKLIRVYEAEILHKLAGKTEVQTLKFDVSAFEFWTKAKGRDMVAEVRPYSMKTRDGATVTGMALADKRALPSLLRVQAPAAA